MCPPKAQVCATAAPAHVPYRSLTGAVMLAHSLAPSHPRHPSSPLPSQASPPTPLCTTTAPWPTSPPTPPPPAPAALPSSPLVGARMPARRSTRAQVLSTRLAAWLCSCPALPCRRPAGLAAQLQCCLPAHPTSYPPHPPAGLPHVVQNEGCSPAVVQAVFPVPTPDVYFFPLSEVRGGLGGSLLNTPAPSVRSPCGCL